MTFDTKQSECMHVCKPQKEDKLAQEVRDECQIGEGWYKNRFQTHPDWHQELSAGS